MMQKPLVVCSFCQKHIIQSPGIQWGRHHDGSESIRENNSAQCVFCSRLYARPSFHTADEAATIPKYIWNFRRPIFQRNQKQTYTVSFRPVLDASSTRKNGQESNQIADPQGELVDEKEFILFQPGDLDAIEDFQGWPSTDCGQTWQLAHRWVDECLRNHSACVSHRDDSIQGRSFMPSRLVKILNADDSTKEDTRIRVVDTFEEQLRAPYMTLSHCWGGSVQSKLLHGTKALYMVSGAPASTLDRTFQDAISACIRLRIEYIWIDSLCICQDDTKDWEKEAALMHKVYRYSYCNIAAADAKVPSDGIFRTRRDEALSFPTCQANPPTKLLGSKKWCIVPKDFWDMELLKSHLYSRAWVFQERMLAPRILHFARDQVFWTCPSRNACEMFPSGIPQFLINDAIFNEDGWRARLRESTNLTYGPRPGATNMVSLETFWRYAVDWYSRCNLTFADDKLIALSGIAKLVGEALGEKHINGLWQNNFVEQLAWRVVHGKKGDGTPSERLKWSSSKMHIPTWSWASMDGVIELVNRKIDFRDEYVTTHDGSDLVTTFETPTETRKRQSSTPAVSPEILQDGFNRFDSLVSRHNSQSGASGSEQDLPTKPPLSRFATPPRAQNVMTPYNAGRQASEAFTQPIPIKSAIGRARLVGTRRNWKWSFDFMGNFEVFPDVDPGDDPVAREVLFTILGWSRVGGRNDDEDEDEYDEDEIVEENEDGDGDGDGEDIDPADALTNRFEEGLGIHFEPEDLEARIDSLAEVHEHDFAASRQPTTTLTGPSSTLESSTSAPAEPLQRSPTSLTLEHPATEDEDLPSHCASHTHDPIPTTLPTAAGDIDPPTDLPSDLESVYDASTDDDENDDGDTVYFDGFGLILAPAPTPSSVPVTSTSTSTSTSTPTSISNAPITTTSTTASPLPLSSTFSPASSSLRAEQKHFMRLGSFRFNISEGHILALRERLITDPAFCDGVDEGGEWMQRWWLV